MAVNPHRRSSIWGTLCDVNCLHSETGVLLKFGRKARGHFVTLTEICVCLIGHFQKHHNILSL